VDIILAGPHPLSTLCAHVEPHVRNAQSHPQQGVRFIGKGAPAVVRLTDNGWTRDYTLNELKGVTEQMALTYQGLEIAFALCKVNHEPEMRKLGISFERVSERGKWYMASQVAWISGFELKAWDADEAVTKIVLKRLPAAMSRSGGPSTIYIEDRAGRVSRQEHSQEAFYWHTDLQALRFLRDMAHQIDSKRIKLRVKTREGKLEAGLTCDVALLSRYAGGELSVEDFVAGCTTYDFNRRPEDEKIDESVRRFMEEVEAGKIKAPS
jgi:hypothetical protein